MNKLDRQLEEVFRIINDEYYQHRAIKWDAMDRAERLLEEQPRKAAVEEATKEKAVMQALLQVSKKIYQRFYSEDHGEAN